MVHIPSDRIRNATYVATEGAERARLIKYIYKRLLLTHPKGLVLDGTVFVDHGVTLPMWARARRFKVFVIGYANGPAQRKARSILKYRRTNDCWTDGKLSEADILHISRQIVSRSRDLRAYCEKHALVYFDVDSGRFDMELRRVTRTILRRMRVTVAGGHSTAGLGELGPIEGGPRAL